MYLLAWEIVAPVLVWKSEFRPNSVLYNAPESQLWAILALVGVIVFILYGASSELGKKEDENSDLTKQVEALKTALPPVSVSGDAVVSVNQAGGVTAKNYTHLGIEPRRITEAVFQTLKERLSPFAGTEITILFLGMNAESTRFAKQIDAVLKQANWKSEINGSLITHEEAGLWVRTPAEQPSEALLAFAEAMREAGFAVGVLIASPDDEDFIAVADNTEVIPPEEPFLLARESQDDG